jgi:hypothetical protein
MSTEKNKWIDAVGRLLELTQTGELRWSPQDPPSYLNLQPERQRVAVVYETRYNERKLRLYQLMYKVDKPIETSGTSGFSGYSVASMFKQTEPHYPYWTKKTVLELLDQSGFGAWTFPAMEVLDDLLAAAQYQAAGVREFLNEILAAAS